MKSGHESPILVTERPAILVLWTRATSKDSQFFTDENVHHLSCRAMIL
jgi:hypothetical protein